MQEGVRVQRYRRRAPRVRRGAAAARRPAREHLPVAHQVRAGQARAAQGARLLGRITMSAVTSS